MDILLTKYNSALLYFVNAILMMQFVILRTCLGLSVPEIWSPPYLLLVGPIYLYYSSYTTSISMQKYSTITKANVYQIFVHRDIFSEIKYQSAP